MENRESVNERTPQIPTAEKQPVLKTEYRRLGRAEAHILSGEDQEGKVLYDLYSNALTDNPKSLNDPAALVCREAGREVLLLNSSEKDTPVNEVQKMQSLLQAMHTMAGYEGKYEIYIPEATAETDKDKEIINAMKRDYKNLQRLIVTRVFLKDYLEARTQADIAVNEAVADIPEDVFKSSIDNKKLRKATDKVRIGEGKVIGSEVRLLDRLHLGKEDHEENSQKLQTLRQERLDYEENAFEFQAPTAEDVSRVLNLLSVAQQEAYSGLSDEKKKDLTLTIIDTHKLIASRKENLTEAVKRGNSHAMQLALEISDLCVQEKTAWYDLTIEVSKQRVKDAWSDLAEICSRTDIRPRNIAEFIHRVGKIKSSLSAVFKTGISAVAVENTGRIKQDKEHNLEPTLNNLQAVNNAFGEVIMQPLDEVSGRAKSLQQKNQRERVVKEYSRENKKSEKKYRKGVSQYQKSQEKVIQQKKAQLNIQAEKIIQSNGQNNAGFGTLSPEDLTAYPDITGAVEAEKARLLMEFQQELEMQLSPVAKEFWKELEDNVVQNLAPVGTRPATPDSDGTDEDAVDFEEAVDINIDSLPVTARQLFQDIKQTSDAVTRRKKDDSSEDCENALDDWFDRLIRLNGLVETRARSVSVDDPRYVVLSSDQAVVFQKIRHFDGRNFDELRQDLREYQWHVVQRYKLVFGEPDNGGNLNSLTDNNPNNGDWL